MRLIYYFWVISDWAYLGGPRPADCAADIIALPSTPWRRTPEWPRTPQ